MNQKEQARQAVQASRVAGLQGIDAETQHRLDMLAYRICEAATMSIADLRVELWHQERQANIATLRATLSLEGASV